MFVRLATADIKTCHCQYLLLDEHSQKLKSVFGMSKSAKPVTGKIKLSELKQALPLVQKRAIEV